jgi:hypothetical protein
MFQDDGDNNRDAKFNLASIFALFGNEKAKKALYLMLILVLSIGSGSATIAGSQQLFSSRGIGFFVGFVIQFFLFVFLANLTPRTLSPSLKMFIVSILMFMSVYTSFFSFYDKFSATDNEYRKSDQAMQAHAKLSSNIYIPIKSELEKLHSQAKDFKFQSEQEAKGLGATQELGRGKEAKNFSAMVVQTQAKIATLEPVVNRLKGYFEFDLNGLKPEEILAKDRLALKEVPYENLPAKYQVLDVQSKIQKADYIKEESQAKLLLPYYRIVDKDSSAFIALAIATSFDLLMFLLGLGIEGNRNKKQPFESSARFSYSQIMGIKNFFAMLKAAFRGRGEAYPDNSILMQELPNFIEVRLQGKGSEFLEYFLGVIDPVTNEIDVKKLFEIENPSFNAGFRILFNALRVRRWITNDPNLDVFKIPDRRYQEFYSWVSGAIADQASYEDSLRAFTAFSNSFREIHINMPDPINVNFASN